MSTEPRVKNAPWFGDRILGFGGLRPITWQGWIVAVALIIGILICAAFIQAATFASVTAMVLLLVAYELISHFTSGRWWSWGILQRFRHQSDSTDQ